MKTGGRSSGKRMSSCAVRALFCCCLSVCADIVSFIMSCRIVWLLWGFQTISNAEGAQLKTIDAFVDGLCVTGSGGLGRADRFSSANGACTGVKIYRKAGVSFYVLQSLVTCELPHSHAHPQLTPAPDIVNVQTPVAAPVHAPRAHVARSRALVRGRQSRHRDTRFARLFDMYGRGSARASAPVPIFPCADAFAPAPAFAFTKS